MEKENKYTTFFFEEYGRMAEKNTFSAFLPNRNKGLWCMSRVDSLKKNLAKIAVVKIVEEYLKNDSFSVENINKFLNEAIKELWENMSENRNELGNISILTVMIEENKLIAGNVGRNKLKIFRENKIFEELDGDKIKEVPLVVNSKLDEKNIFEDKNIKVIYTAPSLDTKVCSLQTKQLNEAAKKYPNVKFYSVTVDTPFAQERFCTANEINGLKAVSDFKYHQFGIQNGFFVKEKGLLTRALTILDENNTVKYIEYVSEEGKEADVEKALKFLENNLIKK